jgi:hypothetical protein
MIPCGGNPPSCVSCRFLSPLQGVAFHKMNPLEKNDGIFVRKEIIRLSIIDDRKKQVFAVIDNYDGGFDEKEIQSVADIIGITETQAHNAFMTLVGLQFLKLNKDKKWVLNEDANWQEGSK